MKVRRIILEFTQEVDWEDLKFFIERLSRHPDVKYIQGMETIEVEPIYREFADLIGVKYDPQEQTSIYRLIERALGKLKGDHLEKDTDDIR